MFPKSALPPQRALQSAARLGASLLMVSLVLPASPAHSGQVELLRSLSGESEFDSYGVGVTGIGDFNGDGFEDTAVGANTHDTAGPNAGRVYVYFGGPESDNTPDLLLDGIQDAEYFGWPLASAGDVNGDGYDDLIVGAYRYDTELTNAGRACLYFGGPNPSTAPALVFYGDQALGQFGSDVSGAGDVDGDGYDDILVAANQYQSDVGRVYLYLGGPSLDDTADLVLDGEAIDDRFGYSVAGAGDTNGDGFADWIVGARFHDTGATDAGRGYLYHGSPTLDGTPDLVFDGETSYDYLGASVSPAGDLDQDGFDDILLGAYGAGNNAEGKAYVYRGGPDADNVPDLVLDGTVGAGLFGIKVSSAGDVNGDSYPDLLIGTLESGPSQSAAYLYYGGTEADAIADVVLGSGTGQDAFGYAVAGAGDYDGDGFDDIIVGAYTAEVAGVQTGTAHIYSGRSYHVLSPVAGQQWIEGEPGSIRWRGRERADVSISVNGGLSWTVVATDVGGQLINTLTIPVPQITPSALARVNRTGESVSTDNSDITDGPFQIVAATDPPPVATVLRTLSDGEAPDDEYGRGLAGIGDLNGDGYDDYAVSAIWNDTGAINAGRVYVHFGGPDPDDVPDLVLTGEASNNNFGHAVEGVGDVNGDGFDDLFVGAQAYAGVGTASGRAYLYHGGPSPDATPDLVLDGPAELYLFGISIAGGDFNGDGFNDLIVGAAGSGSIPFAGAVYLYDGAFASSTPFLTLTGEAEHDFFGTTVRSAGDVNGDGFDDFLVGAPGSDAQGSGTGRVYLYHGGLLPDDVPDLVLTGQPDDQLGSALAGAGDCNGDGFADFIVGASRNHAPGAATGQVYVYCGGPALDTTPEVVLTGLAEYMYFGVDVDWAGDVNRDGFDDILVGAHTWDRADVFYGGPGMDSDPDITLYGETWGDFFGAYLAGAGDVTGDGFDDILIGANWNDAAGNNAGRAYLYDLSRYELLSPTEAQTWNVGSTESVTWLGSEPADLWLSVDGGNSYSLLKSDVGGNPSNTVPLTVPHQPTQFARIKLAPRNPDVPGSAVSDSLFTIEASISLLALRADSGPGGGVTLNWATDPGPEKLAGYRIERSRPDGGWTTIVQRTPETEYHDVNGSTGTRYRLQGVNGLGEEQVLGEVGLVPSGGLSAWPQPFRGNEGGSLNISFATHGGLGGGSGPADVAVFDPQGRRVRTIAQGLFTAGTQIVQWDGRDEEGREVSSGVYFVRSQSAGERTQLKLVVVR